MSNEQFVIRVEEWLIIFNVFFVLTILFVVVATGALQTIETGGREKKVSKNAEM